jgi:hypothetical protein
MGGTALASPSPSDRGHSIVVVAITLLSSHSCRHHRRRHRCCSRRCRRHCRPRRFCCCCHRCRHPCHWGGCCRGLPQDDRIVVVVVPVLVLALVAVVVIQIIVIAVVFNDAVRLDITDVTVVGIVAGALAVNPRNSTKASQGSITHGMLMEQLPLGWP